MGPSGGLILVVDDTPDNVKLLSFDLLDEGYEVATATNGLEAYEAAKANPPDVILLDLMMPVMDGLECCRRLKANPITADIPVVMVSAKDLDATVIEALDAGAHDYVSKPYDLDVMLARVRSAMRVKAAHEAMLAANSALEVARERADGLAEDKARFLAQMSHEIRTPMNGVLGMAKLLLDSGLDTVQNDYARTIESCGNALLALINDVLDFSKMEAGKLELNLIDFHLRTCLDEACNVLSLKAREKGLELSVVVNHDVPDWVCGDPGRLRQVLLNLMNNALKFTESGEVVTCVSLDPPGDDPLRLRIAVRDTGIGIPADKLHRLFKEYGQTDASVASRYGGTGLGLAISKELTTLMAGSIWVDSVPGQGSTFTFTVQLQPPNTVDPGHLITGAALERARNLTVLVVDPSPTYRRVLQQLLLAFGCQPTLAATAQEVAGLWEHRRFDAALIDRSEQRLIADCRAQKVPAVLITDAPERGDAERFEKMGFTGYLPKPIRHDRLLQVLALLALDTSTDAAGGLPQQSSIVTRFTAEERTQGRCRILVADDNFVNQKVASRFLEKLGHRCDIASNGVEAVRATTERAYDLVLMDCQMPKMDGFEATRAIRARPDAPTVVAMTGSTLAEEEEACYAAGMAAHLTKPISLRALQAVLDRFL